MIASTNIGGGHARLSERCDLMGASQNGHSEVVKLLLKKEAKMDLQDDTRRSAGKNGFVVSLKNNNLRLMCRNGMIALNASQNGHMLKLFQHYLTIVLGSCRLCRHNFENNRCTWEFENIPGIIGNFLRIMSDTS